MNDDKTRTEAIALMLSIMAGLRYAYRETAGWHYDAQLDRIQLIGGKESREAADEYARTFEEDDAEALFAQFVRILVSGYEK